MKTFLLTQILKPSVHRIASQLGTFLAAFGVAQGDINTIVAAVTILSGLAIDFVVRKSV